MCVSQQLMIFLMACFMTWCAVAVCHTHISAEVMVYIHFISVSITKAERRYSKQGVERLSVIRLSFLASPLAEALLPRHNGIVCLARGWQRSGRSIPHYTEMASIPRLQWYSL